MSATRPYIVSDDDDESANSSDSELDLLDYGKVYILSSDLRCSSIVQIRIPLISRSLVCLRSLP
jgi:hypothetical protein